MNVSNRNILLKEHLSLLKITIIFNLKIYLITKIYAIQTKMIIVLLIA